MIWQALGIYYAIALAVLALMMLRSWRGGNIVFMILAAGVWPITLSAGLFALVMRAVDHPLFRD